MQEETLEREDTDKFENANELRERFSELEEAKRQKLQSQEESSNDEERDSMAIEGWVEDMEERETRRGDKVDLTVSYVLDDKKQTEEFTLDIPSSESEFSADNEFVRMVNFFGDRRNDPTGLLHREVWLKVQDGNVSLHIPDSLSKYQITREKLKRKRITQGFGGWSEGVVDETYRDGAFSAFSAAVGLFGFFSLASATGPAFAIGTAFLSLVILFTGLVVVGGFLGLSGLGKNERLMRGLIGLTLVASVIACFAGEIGLVEYTIPPQNGEFTTTVWNTIPMYGSFILFAASALMGKEPAKKGVSWVGDKKDSVKTWYQRKKGVEYVDSD